MKAAAAVRRELAKSAVANYVTTRERVSSSQRQREKYAQTRPRCRTKVVMPVRIYRITGESSTGFWNDENRESQRVRPQAGLFQVRFAGDQVRLCLDPLYLPLLWVPSFARFRLQR